MRSKPTTQAAPTVSIGVPVRNGERFLPETLESLLAQSFTDLEILVCDNASDDRTRVIVRDFSRSDRRVRYVRQPHDIGFVANCNYALALANGRFFQWTAADDVWHPDFVRQAVDVLQTDRTVISCYAETAIIDASGTVINHEDYVLDLDAAVPSQRLRAFFSANRRRGYRSHAIFGLTRTDVLRDVGGHSQHVSGDWVTLVALCARGRIHRLPQVLFYNRDHTDRSTGAQGRTTRCGSALSQRLGGGPRPSSEWFDPAKQGRIVLPDWDILWQYTLAVTHAPMKPAERVRSLAFLGAFAARRSPRLARDLLVAAEQSARLAARGRLPWRGELYLLDPNVTGAPADPTRRGEKAEAG